MSYAFFLWRLDNFQLFRQLALNSAFLASRIWSWDGRSCTANEGPMYAGRVEIHFCSRALDDQRRGLGGCLKCRQIDLRCKAIKDLCDGLRHTQSVGQYDGNTMPWSEEHTTVQELSEPCASGFLQHQSVHPHWLDGDHCCVCAGPDWSWVLRTKLAQKVEIKFSSWPDRKTGTDVFSLKTFCRCAFCRFWLIEPESLHPRQRSPYFLSNHAGFRQALPTPRASFVVRLLHVLCRLAPRNEVCSARLWKAVTF